MQVVCTRLVYACDDCVGVSCNHRMLCLYSGWLLDTVIASVFVRCLLSILCGNVIISLVVILEMMSVCALYVVLIVSDPVETVMVG